MSDTTAARQVARRFAVSLAFVAASWVSPPAAFALTGVASPPAPSAAPSASLPGLRMPAPRTTAPDINDRTDRSNGTTASGPVRAQPAHMPFYVATRGQTTIYLLGTLHVGYPDDYPASMPFRAPILGALDASPTLALEISPDDLLVSQDEVSRYGTCRVPCLQRALPDALWKRLEARLRNNNPAMLATISRSRPWLASMLVETLDTIKAGFQTEYGSETQLQNMYLRPRGRVVGLETISEQISAFTRLTQAQQREMLAQDLVQTPAENIADVKELHRLWRIGDADALKAWDDAKTEKIARSKALAAQIDNRVVYDRNYRFVARTVLLAAPNKPIFVAIGALHLGGNRGVLALLRKRGFVVDPA